MKKVFGFILWLEAVFALIGVATRGDLFSDKGSAAATYGYFLGTLLPVVLFFISGFFLFTFDNPTKLTYIDGFKKRSKQSSIASVLLIVYMLLFFCVKPYGSDNAVVGYLIGAIPYVIPFVFFMIIYLAYALPHNASKKYFMCDDAALNEYLSANETFRAYTEDKAVLASGKALFFPQLFCAIPFSQISSIELKKELWEQNVYFHLSNNKKFYIVSKHYDRISEAIKEHSEVKA